MSRVEKTNSNYQIVYGLDHIYGIFVQVFDISQDEDADPIVDLDVWHDKTLTVERIVAIAEEYGFDLSAELTEGTIE